MVQVQFALSWDNHNSNYSYGLSALQQNGEFVDMTLAADGHHVQVHQLILALASPYIKELITTARCPHPVIFLNKISYTTLCALLEYVYTGEVLVAQDCLTELMEAGKELHIKGLEEMKLQMSPEDMALQALLNKKVQEETLPESVCTSALDRTCQSELNDTTYSSQTISDTTYSSQTIPDTMYSSQDLLETTYSKESLMESEIPNFVITKLPTLKGDQVQEILDDVSQMSMDSHRSGHSFIDVDDSININEKQQDDAMAQIISSKPELDTTKITVPEAQILYTVSCQGSLQMILNRYIYYLRYTWKDGSQRKWQCINYIRKRCPAAVCTKGDIVVERLGAHNHPFHDKQVLKRLKNSSVYTTVIEAEAIGRSQKLMKTKKRAKCKENETEVK